MFKKLLLVGLILLQSCSVFMASDGSKTPQIQSFNEGMTRFQVESVLGGPVSFEKQDDGSKTAIYEFISGKEPSTGRAFTWLALDIITLWTAEFILTPYEMNRGTVKRIRVTYDKNYIVTNLEI